MVLLFSRVFLGVSRVSPGFFSLCSFLVSRCFYGVSVCPKGFCLGFSMVFNVEAI